MGQPSKILADLEAYAQNWRPWRPLAVADNTRVVIPRIQIGEPKVYPIKKGETGDRVQELRIRLAGFGPLKPGHTFDEATEKSVKLFEKDVMGRSDPTGIVDTEFAKRLDLFATEWPIHFKQLECPCATCGGFGIGQNKGKYYRSPELEKYHQYEYPGVHRCLLWGVRAIMFYCTIDHKNSIRFQKIFSGYRCDVDNRSHGRPTTNHMGKAVDLHFETWVDNEWKRRTLSDDANFKSCNKIRELAAKRLKASTSWVPGGEFGLEPGGSRIKQGEAYTWVHLDVREWDKAFLDDDFFVKTAADLDGESMNSLLSTPSGEQLFGSEE